MGADRLPDLTHEKLSHVLWRFLDGCLQITAELLSRKDIVERTLGQRLTLQHRHVCALHLKMRCRRPRWDASWDHSMPFFGRRSDSFGNPIRLALQRVPRLGDRFAWTELRAILLHDVRQLVCDQMASRWGRWCVRARREDHMFSDRISTGADSPCRLVGTRIGVNADTAEVEAETSTVCCAQVSIQVMSLTRENNVNCFRDSERPRRPIAFALYERAARRKHGGRQVAAGTKVGDGGSL